LIAAIQGAAKRQLGQTFTNAEVADLVHSYGPITPDVIGPRPDLPAMLAAMGAIDGLTVDLADVTPGGAVTVTIDGPAGSLAALFASFATADIPLGFNRNLHLDLASLASLDAFVLPSGTAQYQLAIPNNASLHDVDVYFQAARLTGTQPLFVTNSCQTTIL
jgi:hypothetical protein